MGKLFALLFAVFLALAVSVSAEVVQYQPSINLSSGAFTNYVTGTDGTQSFTWIANATGNVTTVEIAIGVIGTKDAEMWIFNATGNPAATTTSYIYWGRINSSQLDAYNAHYPGVDDGGAHYNVTNSTGFIQYSGSGYAIVIKPIGGYDLSNRLFWLGNEFNRYTSSNWTANVSGSWVNNEQGKIADMYLALYGTLSGSSPVPSSGYKEVVVNITSTTGIPHYQVALNVSFSPAMNANFSDLRFYNYTNSSIPFWIEDQVNGSWAAVHVRTPLINGVTQLYMRYGNNESTSGSNGTATWDFFEDFNGAAIDDAVWEYTTPHPGWAGAECINRSIGSGYLELGRDWDDPQWCTFYTKDDVAYLNNMSIKVIMRVYESTVETDGSMGVGVFEASSSDYFASSSLFGDSFIWRSYLGNVPQTIDTRDMWATKKIRVLNTTGTMSYYGSTGTHVNPNISLQFGGADGTAPVANMANEIGVYILRGTFKADYFAVGPAFNFTYEPSAVFGAEQNYSGYVTTTEAVIAPSAALPSDNLVGNCTGVSDRNVSYEWFFYNGTSIYSSGNTSTNYTSGLSVNVANVSVVKDGGTSWVLQCTAFSELLRGASLNSTAVNVTNIYVNNFTVIIYDMFNGTGLHGVSVNFTRADNGTLESSLLTDVNGVASVLSDVDQMIVVIGKDGYSRVGYAGFSGGYFNPNVTYQFNYSAGVWSSFAMHKQLTASLVPYPYNITLQGGRTYVIDGSNVPLWLNHGLVNWTFAKSGWASVSGQETQTAYSNTSMVGYGAYYLFNISFNFFDEETGASLNGSTVYFEMISTVDSLNLTTSTGKLDVTGLTSNDYQIRYGALGYANRLYSLSLVDGNDYTINLSLLNSSAGSNVTVQVSDLLGNSLSGAVVKVLKYDILTNAFVLNQVLSTNYNGETQAYLILNDEFYQFIIEYDGTTVSSTDPTYVYSSPLVFRVAIGNSGFETFFNRQQLVGDFSAHDYTAHTSTFYWDDGYGVASSGCIYVYTYPELGLIDTQCGLGAAGSISVTVSNATEATYLLKGAVIRGGETFYLASDYVSYVVEMASGKLGLFLGFILLVVIVGIGLWRLSVAVLLGGVTPLFLQASSLISIGYPAAIAVLLTGVLVAYVVEKGA